MARVAERQPRPGHGLPAPGTRGTLTVGGTSRAMLLFTGFPGFIGARLLPRLLELIPGSSFACLVQEKFLGLAKHGVERIEAAHPDARGRLATVVGDITQAGLGLADGEARSLQDRLTGAFHLAAVYDLAVERDVGMKINVLGTQHVLDFLEGAKRLERLHYVSTAYVSGTAVGTYRESDLDVGQRFKNHYEETKFLAEVAVKQRGLPVTIYRPGVTVGDSRTGETGKFDGPYFALAAMWSLPSRGPFLKVGSGKNPINIVPVDFVIEGMARLAAWSGSGGRTYHLTDPDPLSVAEVTRLFARALGKSFVYVPVPLALAKAVFGPRPMRRFLGVPLQTLDYFDHPCRYDASAATRDLEPLGVACPRLEDYAQKLVDFYRAKRMEIGKSAMI